MALAMLAAWMGERFFRTFQPHEDEQSAFDALLIQRSSTSAERAGLSDRIDYKLIEPGPLPLTDGSCDVVFGKESWLFIEDRPGFFAEAFRVLRPGGFLVGSDWTSNGQPPSDNLLRYYELRGAEYDLKTEAWYSEHLEQAGFTRVTTVDATDSASKMLSNDHERMRGPLREALVDTLQPEGYEHFLELWGLIATMMTDGELRTVIVRGQKGG